MFTKDDSKLLIILLIIAILGASFALARGEIKITNDELRMTKF